MLAPFLTLGVPAFANEVTNPPVAVMIESWKRSSASFASPGVFALFKAMFTLDRRYDLKLWIAGLFEGAAYLPA